MNIIGRLTSDAQVQTLSNKKQVVNFSVAVNDNYRNKEGETIQQTTYFDCAYWISINVAKILTKGALVELWGRVSARAWVNAQGEPKAGLNFHTSKIKLHHAKKSEATINTQNQEQKQLPTTNEDLDDLPF
ncbi:MAG: single-stranded DNA-binding protein [Capnocytophaga sp.]|nr:single-stranded DNA-binding protein [Capnocytophaga sp.]